MRSHFESVRIAARIALLSIAGIPPSLAPLFIDLSFDSNFGDFATDCSCSVLFQHRKSPLTKVNRALESGKADAIEFGDRPHGAEDGGELHHSDRDGEPRIESELEINQGPDGAKNLGFA